MQYKYHLALAWPVRFIWSNSLDLEGKDYVQPLHFIPLPLPFYCSPFFDFFNLAFPEFSYSSSYYESES